MRTRQDIRIGIDMVEVDQVEGSMERFGSRYLERIFTGHELDCAQRGSAFDAGTLAARFAAKEATIKVLGPDGAQPPWKSMEICRHRGGQPRLVLSGVAEQMARHVGITSMAVSLTHESKTAAAAVIALCRKAGPVVTTETPPLTYLEIDPTESRRMAQIGIIVQRFAKLSSRWSDINPDSDLFDAGMTSHASVNVMLALEETFHLEFPEPMLRKSTFESIQSIANSVAQLLACQPTW